MTYSLVLSDAVETLKTLRDGCVDAIVTDPPYPEIDREYGRMSEAEWFTLMRSVVDEGHRVLKPSGSMMLLIQPNSEKLGRMRAWVWKFLAWCCEEYNVVQDTYWWNWAAMPLAGSQRSVGLLRSSLKYCVWLGAPDCTRYQDAVLWEASDSVKALQREKRAFRPYTSVDGKHIDKNKIMGSSEERGGVTPFNVIPCANTDSSGSAGAYGHPAGTPAKLVNWWLRYLTKPGDLVIDPFNGSATVTLEAVKMGRLAIGIERFEKYHQIAVARHAELDAERAA